MKFHNVISSALVVVISIASAQSIAVHEANRSQPKVDNGLKRKQAEVQRRSKEDQLLAHQLEADSNNAMAKWAEVLKKKTENVEKTTIDCLLQPLKCFKEAKKPPSAEDITKLVIEGAQQFGDLRTDIIDLSARVAELDARRLEAERQRRDVERTRREKLRARSQPQRNSPRAPQDPLPIDLPPLAAPPRDIGPLSDKQISHYKEEIEVWCYEEIAGDRCFGSDDERFRQFIKQHPNASNDHHAAFMLAGRGSDAAQPPAKRKNTSRPFDCSELRKTPCAKVRERSMNVSINVV
jgi:hypothetical protein